MEMESSRRSIDSSRSREQPIVKKPRLVSEPIRDPRIVDGGRPFHRVPAAAAPITGPTLTRVRANVSEREAERSNFGRGVERLSYQQQITHSNEEIVSEYRTALAELTFNSKPIINNLTIIAGENLDAAKGISASICSNIIEVPSELKLPSLYLLDSIVKNVGGDYIKCFAGRLPEVFCKAYRQVDSSIHPGMRHLFRTWKGVFPPACLQMIEKELGFTPAISVSTSGASRPDSQSQRPANGIHVNPKYLEARQRLQQPSRVKGDDNAGAALASVDDAEIPERVAIIGPGRPWTDLSPKQDFRHPKRGALSESVHEKKTGVVYEHNKYGSDLSRHSDMDIGKSSERVSERVLPWYAGGSDAADATVSQRNSVNSGHILSNHRTPKSSQAIGQLQPTQQSTANRSSVGMPRIQTNFEEEYIWDEIKSRLRDDGGRYSSSKDGWTPDNAQTTEFENSLPQSRSDHDIGLRSKRETFTDSLTMAQRREAGSGQQTSSVLSLQESHSENGLNHKEVPSRYLGLSDGHSTFVSGLTSMTSSTVRTGLQSLTGPSVGAVSTSWSLESKIVERGASFGKQRQKPLRSASPSGQSSMHQTHHSPIPSALRRGQESSPSLTEYAQSPSVGAASTSWSLLSTVVEPGAAFGKQWQQPLRSVSPSGQSSMHPRPHSPIPSALRQHQELSPSSVGYDQSPSVGVTSNSWSLVSTVVESGAVFGQQRQKPLQSASPSGQSSMHQHPLSPPIHSALRQHQESSPSSIEFDRSQIQSLPAKKGLQLVGLLNGTSHSQTNQDSYPSLPLNHSHPSRTLHLIQSHTSQNRQGSSSLMPSHQLGKNSTLLKQPHQELIQSQPSGPIQRPVHHPSILEPPVRKRTSALSHSSNTSVDMNGQLSRSSLSAGIMTSALQPDKSVTHFHDSFSNIRRPLPSGPPPTQSAASSASIVPSESVVEPASGGSTPCPSLSTLPKKTSVPPPLPPGPPPASFVVGTTPVHTSNPLSGLLNSLVVKGLISAPAKNSPNLISTHVPSQLLEQSSVISTSSSMTLSSGSALSIIPSSSSGNELPIPESAAGSFTTLSRAMPPEIKDLIGVEFKPEIIRESHPSVIRFLFDDLPHRCDICGLRLKLRERLEKHLEWHASRMHEAGICNSVSRGWYVSLAEWVTGSAGLSSGPTSISLERSVKTAENSEPVVPADESQSICLLCGEPFEDFYSFEKETWMFKGAVDLPILNPEGKKGTMDESSSRGPFVHASCKTPSSLYDLGLAKNFELDQMDE